MPCRELRFVLSVVFYVVSENPQNCIGSKSCRNQKKTPENPKISGVVLELLGRFELPTSSLPILPWLFFPTLLCFVLKPETLAAQVFQAFLFCIFIFPVLRSRMGFLMPVWVLYGFCVDYHHYHADQ